MNGTELMESTAKALVVRWIEDLIVSGDAVPDAVKRELLDELASATPVSDAEGRMCLEIPGLSSLGVGIFQRSFVVLGKVVRVSPYVHRDIGAAPAPASGD